MSSFQVAATSVSFIVSDQGFTERKDDVLRVWDLSLYLDSPTDYATLLSLWSGPVSVRTCPGTAGATPYVDIAGGAGAGTLTVDNVADSPFTAALVRLERPSAYPGGSRVCRATFQECP
jgi:hypothetical protein